MSSLESIIKWGINEISDWQSDAVRRILTQESLTEDDEQELLDMLKFKYSLCDKRIDPIPLKRGDVSGDQIEEVSMRLKRIDEINEVNAIPNGSSIIFAHSGLNIIYGENGSGKSGYARILKNACNARDTKERILPNVFTTGVITPANAKFKISINDGIDKEINWADGTGANTQLSNICVFDSKCARVIIDENNEVTYLPYGAHVFQVLVDVLRKMKSKLEMEKPKIKKLEYPDIPITTKAGEYISKISKDTNVLSIEQFGNWTESDEGNLNTLKKQILEAEINGPEVIAKRIRMFKNRIVQLKTTIESCNSIFSLENDQKINLLINRFNTTEEARKIISNETLSNEPLPGIGSSAWKTLYDSAKQYSIKEAYPNEDFPNIANDSVCVLCMQPLSQEAQERFKKFKAFMEDKTQKDLNEIINLLEAQKKSISTLVIPTIESIKELIDEISERDAELSNEVIVFFENIIRKSKENILTINERKLISNSQAIISPVAKICTLVDQLEKEAQDIEKTANPEENEKKVIQKNELEAKKLLVQRKRAITDYIKQLVLLEKYDKCLAATDTRQITNRGKTIVSQALTPVLTSQLEQELNCLGAGHIPLNLKPTGSEGETRHKLELVGCQARKINLTEILSEGEQHVVAIAGFLAELSVSGNKCPIIFDDPVCSLDHRYRDKIASRLIKEAKDRQVIVFTHDIAFLISLEIKASDNNEIYFYPQTIRKIGTFVGRSAEGLPWHAMLVKDRISYLNSMLDSIQSLLGEDITQYNVKAGNLYGLMREAWEALIEEVLFNHTVIRHAGEVQTQRLRSVSVTTEDYQTINTNMGKCSTWMIGHDRSKSLDENRPVPADIREDIRKLKDFAKLLRERSERIGAERRDAVSPTKPSESMIG